MELKGSWCVYDNNKGEDYTEYLFLFLTHSVISSCWLLLFRYG